MYDSIARAVGFLQRLLLAALMLCMWLCMLGMLAAVPLGLAYIAIKPAFDPDPLDSYTALGAELLPAVLLFGGLGAVAWLYGRVRIITVAVQLIGLLLLAAVVAGGVLQFFSDSPSHCVESRYWTC